MQTKWKLRREKEKSKSEINSGWRECTRARAHTQKKTKMRFMMQQSFFGVCFSHRGGVIWHTHDVHATAAAFYCYNFRFSLFFIPLFDAHLLFRRRSALSRIFASPQFPVAAVHSLYHFSHTVSATCFTFMPLSVRSLPTHDLGHFSHTHR